ncbi:MAG: PIN domain-containing protein [Chloroflexi bacterium]|nr:PIN domain-containing protein [Chloroflexota bacterium]
MKYLLDSSAWLAHLFGEPGVEQVNLLFDLPQNEINISTLSILEVYGCLRSMGRQAHWPEIWTVYGALFTKILPADEAIAHQAILLRTVTPERLPTIDGLIAATAVVHHLTLVHRDLHLAAIPAHHLPQLPLADK